MRAHSAHQRPGHGRVLGLLAAISTALLAGACANGSDPLQGLDSMLSSAPAADAKQQKAEDRPRSNSAEMDKALAYWSEEYKKKPTDLKVALSYARNLKAAGHKDQSFGVLQGAALLHGDSTELASEYGRLALEYDQIAIAEKLLAMADDPVKPDWRVISARGAVLAKQGKYADSIPFFERALQISPNQPSVMNNLAMAHAAAGDPARAEQILRQASTRSNDPKLKQNLALVLGLQNKHEEARTFATANLPPAVASSDVEYVKAMVKPTAPPPVAMPAVVKQPAQPAKGGRIIQAKTAPTKDLRPSGGPSEVGSSGWSTTVSVEPPR